MADQTPQHPSTFTVTSSAEGSVGILALSGAVSMDADDHIQTAYRALTSGGAKRIRLQFTNGTTINSAGIAVLITIAGEARKARQKVEVSGLTPHYRKIFDMIGLTDYVEIV